LEVSNQQNGNAMIDAGDTKHRKRSVFVAVAFLDLIVYLSGVDR